MDLRLDGGLALVLTPLLGLLIREAGKTAANAVAELREAVDFLRYYATQGARLPGSAALGAVACISPWNFPLAIFTGQVAAALAAGNAVLAKPAEETPLIAAAAAALLHEAGIPPDILHLLPGQGETGARLVADPRVNGVVFTGSTETARLIRRTLATRLNPDGSPVPLIAETGGQNAMIVDSSALAEQVVADILISAFDSAGQRCSALRVLYVHSRAKGIPLDPGAHDAVRLWYSVCAHPDRLARSDRDLSQLGAVRIRETGVTHDVAVYTYDAASAKYHFYAIRSNGISDVGIAVDTTGIIS